MLGKRSKELISHIEAHSKRVILKTTTLAHEEFLLDKDAIEIVAFNILQIGELVKRLPIEFTKEYSEIPWKKIAGTRDRIAHGYETIDVEFLWIISTEELPDLIEFCNQIMTQECEDNKVVEIVDNSKEK